MHIHISCSYWVFTYGVRVDTDGHFFPYSQETIKVGIKHRGTWLHSTEPFELRKETQGTARLGIFISFLLKMGLQKGRLPFKTLCTLRSFWQTRQFDPGFLK